MARSRKNGNANPQGENRAANQSILPLALHSDEHLSISTLETWLWDAACAIRGATDAPKFKDFILPLIFYKRLSDVFDDECSTYVDLYGSEELARQIIEADHQGALADGHTPIVRFFIPEKYSWLRLRNHPADGTLGEFVTDALRDVAKLNPALQGVLDVRDYNERQSGQRTLDEERLAALIEVISRYRAKERLCFKSTEICVLNLISACPCATALPSLPISTILSRRKGKSGPFCCSARPM